MKTLTRPTVSIFKKFLSVMRVSVMSILILMMAFGEVAPVFFPTPTAQAAISKLIPLSRRVTDSGGTPVADGAHTVIFTLYNSSNASVWTETQAVTTTNGVFSTTLGSTNNLDAVDFTADTFTIGYKVDALTEVKEAYYPAVGSYSSATASTADTATTAEDAQKLGGVAATDYPTKQYLTDNRYVQYDAITGKVAADKLPFSEGDVVCGTTAAGIVSDKVNAGEEACTGDRFDVANLTPENVKEGITFGPGGTIVGTAKDTAGDEWGTNPSSPEYVQVAASEICSDGATCFFADMDSDTYKDVVKVKNNATIDLYLYYPDLGKMLLRDTLAIPATTCFSSCSNYPVNQAGAYTVYLPSYTGLPGVVIEVDTIYSGGYNSQFPGKDIKMYYLAEGNKKLSQIYSGTGPASYSSTNSREFSYTVEWINFLGADNDATLELRIKRKDTGGGPSYWTASMTDDLLYFDRPTKTWKTKALSASFPLAYQYSQEPVSARQFLAYDSELPDTNELAQAYGSAGALMNYGYDLYYIDRNFNFTIIGNLGDTNTADNGSGGVDGLNSGLGNISVFKDIAPLVLNITGNKACSGCGGYYTNTIRVFNPTTKVFATTYTTTSPWPSYYSPASFPISNFPANKRLVFHHTEGRLYSVDYTTTPATLSMLYDLHTGASVTNSYFRWARNGEKLNDTTFWYKWINDYSQQFGRSRLLQYNPTTNTVITREFEDYAAYQSSYLINNCNAYYYSTPNLQSYLLGSVVARVSNGIGYCSPTYYANNPQESYSTVVAYDITSGLGLPALVNFTDSVTVPNNGGTNALRYYTFTVSGNSLKVDTLGYKYATNTNRPSFIVNGDTRTVTNFITTSATQTDLNGSLTSHRLDTTTGGFNLVNRTTSEIEFFATAWTMTTDTQLRLTLSDGTYAFYNIINGGTTLQRYYPTVYPYDLTIVTENGKTYYFNGGVNPVTITVTNAGADNTFVSSGGQMYKKIYDANGVIGYTKHTASTTAQGTFLQVSTGKYFQGTISFNADKVLSTSGLTEITNFQANQLSADYFLVNGGKIVKKNAPVAVSGASPVTVNLAQENAQYYNASTLLQDGSVLVTAGNLTGSGLITPVENYNPTTKVWTTKASMTTVRNAHTTTLLSNGKVLMIGGKTVNNTVLNSVELYDPALNTWTTKASMVSPRYNHTATLLADGKVLVAGGYNGADPISTVEVYDPTLNTWTTKTSMATARAYHTATLRSDGTVVMIGGRGASNGFLTSVELYNPTANTWTTKASMTTARAYHTATLLSDGTIVAIGGSSISNIPTTSVELYNPTANTWTTKASMTTARAYHTATLLASGDIVVAGGYTTGSSVSTQTVQTFTPSTNTWQSSGDMATPRFGHNALLVASNAILFVGGFNSSGASNSYEHYYTGGSNTWLTKANMVTARYYHQSATLSDGKVLVAGGYIASPAGSTNLVEVYDPVANTWTSKTSMSSNRQYFSLLLLSTGKVLAIGGHNGSTAVGTVEMYDPALNTWTAKTAMSTARYQHSAVVLSDGKVLVIGGTNASGTVLNTVEVYDPVANSWTTKASMPVARSAPSATLLSDGKVLVVGGYSGGAQNTVYVYDPATNVWTQKANLNSARYNHPAVLLQNGKVLVAGGYQSTATNSAEIYDTVANTWTMTNNNMSVVRGEPVAVLLSSGNVLISGGTNVSSATELYNPTTSTFTTISASAARNYNTINLLQNGKVLVAGGYIPSPGGPTNSTELYDFVQPSVSQNIGTSSQTITLADTDWKILPELTGAPVGYTHVVGTDTKNYKITDQSIASLTKAPNDIVDASVVTSKASIATPRTNFASQVLADGKVLIFGGNGSAVTEMYDPVANTWTTKASMNFWPNNSGAMSSILFTSGAYSGKVFISGGNSNTSGMYDPVANTWTAKANMNTRRVDSTMTLLQDGKVLVVGGADYGTSTILSSAEVYDPVANTWTNKASMTGARMMHTATLLSDGKVLVAGGTRLDGTKLNTVEVYDPVANTWTVKANMSIARYAFTANLIAGNKVLVIGGNDGSSGALNTVEVYDIATNTWTTKTSMSAKRYYHTATTLSSGKVLVVGGTATNHLNSVELYDPTTDTWTQKPNITTARFSHSAVKMNDGKVFIIGGQNSSMTPTTELYESLDTTNSVPNNLWINNDDFTANTISTQVVTGVTFAQFAPSTFTYYVDPWSSPSATMLMDPSNGKRLTFNYDSVFGIQASSTYFAGYIDFIQPVNTSCYSGLPYEKQGVFSTQYGMSVVALGSDKVVRGTPVVYRGLNSCSRMYNLNYLNYALVRVAYPVYLMGADKVIWVKDIQAGQVDYGNGWINVASEADLLATQTSANLATLLTLTGSGRNNPGQGAIDLKIGDYNAAKGYIEDNVAVVGSTRTAKSITSDAFNFLKTKSAQSWTNQSETLATSVNTGYVPLLEYTKNATKHVIYRDGAEVYLIKTGSTKKLLAFLGTNVTLQEQLNGDYFRLNNEVVRLDDNNVTWLYSMDSSNQYPVTYTDGLGLGQARTFLAVKRVTDGSYGILDKATLSFYTKPTPAIPFANRLWTAKTTLTHTVPAMPSSYVANTAMNAVRGMHGSTTLSDGVSVLVAGGDNSGTPLATSEIYNSSTGTWTTKASMGSARRGTQAVTLNDGRALVSGGINASGTVINSAEAYTVASNTWSGVASMNYTRYGHTLTKLSDGRVIAIGGYNSSSLSTVEIYNPSTNSWTNVASMPTTRYAHAATLLPDGKVFISGGLENNGWAATTMVYDPVANTWTYKSGMSTYRYGHSSSLLANGKVLVSGGYYNGAATTFSGLYDPATDSWSSDTSSMVAGRFYNSATTLANGKVVITGGYNSASNSINSSETYTPLTASSTANYLSYNHASDVMNDGKVILIGGGNGATSTSNTEIFDPATNAWTSKASMAVARQNHTLTELANNAIIVVGGNNGTTAVSSVEAYTPSTNTWATKASMVTARQYHTATLLQNGKILVVGGNNGTSAVSSVELYDPTANTWTTKASMANIRQYHTATLLTDGKVLIAGGTNGTTPVSTVEIYDPAIDTWTTKASMSAARAYHTAVLLQTGKVLVSGGSSAGTTAAVTSMEVYDADLNTWTSTVAMSVARRKHTANVLADGKVLLVGGENSGVVTNKVDLYDPSTNTIEAQKDLVTARSTHTTNVLSDNTIFVAGGFNGSAGIANTEAYNILEATTFASHFVFSPSFQFNNILHDNAKNLSFNLLNNQFTTRLFQTVTASSINQKFFADVDGNLVIINRSTGNVTTYSDMKGAGVKAETAPDNYAKTVVVIKDTDNEVRLLYTDNESVTAKLTGVDLDGLMLTSATNKVFPIATKKFLIIFSDSSYLTVTGDNGNALSIVAARTTTKIPTYNYVGDYNNDGNKELVIQASGFTDIYKFSDIKGRFVITDSVQGTVSPTGTTRTLQEDGVNVIYTIFSGNSTTYYLYKGVKLALNPA